MASNVDEEIAAGNASWTFDGIAESFDGHISRSVPMYLEGHDLICQLSDFFLPPGAIITELGPSTGSLAAKILQRHPSRSDISYIGIDSVASMLEKASNNCKGDQRASFVCDDIVTCDIPSSSLIICYYTLQFVRPKHRQAVVDKIYSALEWGGALIMFEKVRAPDARFQDISTQLYTDFKLGNNFSEEEIINKSRSLKGILEPFSTQANYDLMGRAGFVDMMTVAKWICFEGFLAIK